MKEKIIAIVLLIAIITTLASCKKKEENNNIQNKEDEKLSIEIEEIKYTEEDISAASNKIKELTMEFARILGYANQIGDEDIEKSEKVFRNDVLMFIL